MLFSCRERVLAQERAEKERQELERKKERDMQIKREMEKLREQVSLAFHSTGVTYITPSETTIIALTTWKPFYYMVHYSTVSDITWFIDGSWAQLFKASLA